MAMIDDSELYIPPGSGICDLCRHRRFSYSGRVCTAFPDGIPMPIWRAEHDHQTPYPGDHGIRWERLRAEDINVLRAVARGEEPPPELSVAELADRQYFAKPVGAAIDRKAV